MTLTTTEFPIMLKIGMETAIQVQNRIHTADETDWQNPISDGVNPDPSNSVYLEIDLSGNGVVGRNKTALGMNPLNPSNPLALTQVITGDEPQIVTFEVPINYNTALNAGTLNVNMNGIDVTLEEWSPATDGNCLLSFNVAFVPP